MSLLNPREIFVLFRYFVEVFVNRAGEQASRENLSVHKIQGRVCEINYAYVVMLVRLATSRLNK